MVYAPIYKDTYYTTTAATLAYRIYLDDSLIFSGKAYRRPNGDPIEININKVCQNYLEQDIDDLLTGSSSSQRNESAIGDFVLKDAGGTTLETYRFLFDWEYGHTWSGAAATLSVPINGEYIDGQMKLKTNVAATTNNVNTYRSTGDYDKQVCADYCLYYVNQRGGWDCFVFHKGDKTDNFTPHSYSKAFDNNTYDFENKRYITEVETVYKLSTGILSEDQSKLFAKHLVGSNKCYLHNVTEGWIKPVVITDNSVSYKSDDDGNVVAYQITVKESQTKQRM